MARVRVLVVDDSVTIRAMVARVLEVDPDIRVVAVAASASEADHLLADTPVDVVTLDVEMPGMNGMDYLRSLTLRRPALPVIMLSSQTAPDSTFRTDALRAGAVGCFPKADAVRCASDLIKLVKAAAAHTVRLGQDDLAALAERAAANLR